MSDLQEARKKINEVDARIAKLFEERMDAAALVAKYKMERGLPVFDGAREKEVLDKNLEFIEKKEYEAYYTLFQQNLMDISKSYQSKIISGMKVAFSGVEGAFAHIAAGRIFPQSTLKAYSGFEKAYRSVEKGECDCVVIPIENSIAGEVGSNMDLIFDGTLYINGIYELEVKHNLLGVPGAKASDIREVVSHYQALEQCDGYIKEHNLATRTFVNTAMAAKEVAERKNKSVGAIASRETAGLYGLEILAEKINDANNNTTRFAVLSRQKNDGKKQDHFVMMFTVSHQAGALAKAIDIIGKYGFNMEAIKSRSLKEQLWKYYFYTEIEGNPYEKLGAIMLGELEEICDQVRVIGTYNAHEMI